MQKGVKMKFNGKKIMSVTLVIMLCAAIYLNYNYNKDGSNGDTAKLLGEAAYVNNDVTVEDNIDTFESQKTEREKSKEYAMELLDEVISNEKSTADIIKEAQSKKIRIAESIVHEADCEAVLKSKGFSNVLITITDEMATVSLKVENLIPAQIAQIQEVISSTAKISPENIKIVLSR